MRASRAPSLATPTRTSARRFASAAGVSQSATALETATPGATSPKSPKSPKRHATSRFPSPPRCANAAPASATTAAPVSGPLFGATRVTEGGAVNSTRRSEALFWYVPAS